MGKAPPKHLRARLQYLFDAAKYLRKVQESTSQPRSKATKRKLRKDNPSAAECRGDVSVTASEAPENETEATANSLTAGTGAADHFLISQVRSIAAKAQIRLEKETKHQLCKGCDAVLIPNVTSTTMLENNSKAGTKPWATTKIVCCNLCGVSKRFPIGAKRQLEKALRG